MLVEATEAWAQAQKVHGCTQPAHHQLLSIKVMQLLVLSETDFRSHQENKEASV